MSMILSTTFLHLAKVPTTNSRADADPIAHVMPNFAPTSNHNRPYLSFGVRSVHRGKSSLRDITIGLVKAARPGFNRSGRGRSHAHTVWVSGNRLFAITGFDTEAFDLDQVSIVAKGTTAQLKTPEGTAISIKPSGPSWRKFFDHLSERHPQVTIARRVWALTNRSDSEYEYFERQ